MGQVYREHDPADAATICANRRSIHVEFGVLESDESRRLRSYTEKPSITYEVSMGVNVLSSSTIEAFVERAAGLNARPTPSDAGGWWRRPRQTRRCVLADLGRISISKAQSRRSPQIIALFSMSVLRVLVRVPGADRRGAREMLRDRPFEVQGVARSAGEDRAPAALIVEPGQVTDSW